MKKLAEDKHSSLLYRNTSDEEKRVVILRLDVNATNLFIFLTDAEAK